METRCFAKYPLSSRYWLKAKLTEQPQDSAIPLLGVCRKEFEDSNDAVIQLNQRAEETPGVHQAHFYIQSSKQLSFQQQMAGRGSDML